MYNRYIPQPDGSHKKNRMPDPIPPQRPPQQHQPQPECPPHCPEPTPNPPPCPCPPPAQHTHHEKRDSIPDFFRQLLPRNIDTADLLIIILLLLMCGDREEDKTNALLTLALYFFM